MEREGGGCCRPAQRPSERVQVCRSGQDTPEGAAAALSSRNHNRVKPGQQQANTSRAKCSENTELHGTDRLGKSGWQEKPEMTADSK